jgi:hypothetical protein
VLQEKRRKNFAPLAADAGATPQAQRSPKFFASFCSQKEVSTSALRCVLRTALAHVAGWLIF